ncbi:MAG: rhodanese-like domain-containing protein [Gammaproteobacteria bacterium]|nr:rhodanese-like domain-containing protein [Gammaproteobacteria bacterium]
MKNYNDLMQECLETVQEVFPWDLDEAMQAGQDVLLLDVREQDEYDAMHIQNSLFVPRGVLESACEWGFDDTVPELVQAREREVVVICRSGNRSAFAAKTMQDLGYQNVKSLKTGIRGWNDFELPLIDKDGKEVDIDDADEFLASKVSAEQMGPQQ